MEDVNRPDVNGVPPKMLAVKEALRIETEGLLPFMTFHTDDNLMSSVTVRGTKEPKAEWLNGIFQNAAYFILSVTPAKGRYYEGGPVTIDLLSRSSRLPKLRRYTGTPEKAIAKFKQWLLDLE